METRGGVTRSRDSKDFFEEKQLVTLRPNTRWRAIAEHAYLQRQMPSNKEDTGKSDKSSGDKKKKKTNVDEEDLDVEDLITQILRDRPPTYGAHEEGPSTSSVLFAPAQVTATVGPGQTSNGQLAVNIPSGPNALLSQRYLKGIQLNQAERGSVRVSLEIFGDGGT
ncbi:hypothetical protein NDU88_003378 [Pleurodeles waltl]|uniref:Uncharacterized protein n=1 Tax=Pleurodeles waltl TaxID=8319 RepID=A0AAV7SDA1_PLEWA|nr:hypothetical protein NDU88_003378 [Pleurodeles waltl]